MGTSNERVLGIYPVKQGDVILWQRVVNTESGLIIQLFRQQPNDDTEDFSAIAAIGPNLWGGKLNVQIWDERSLLAGDDPKHTIHLMDYPPEETKSK